MIIDNRSLIKKIDKSGMLDLLEKFALQCKEADSIEVSCVPQQKYDCIIWAGMGGSAIAGDILKQVIQHNCSTPFFVHRNYGLPKFVSNKSLVLGISYSGDTEETCDACTEAVNRGAMVWTLSSGGKLEEFAMNNRIPHVKIPSGQPPRCSLGYLFFPPANLLFMLGYIKKIETEKIAEIADMCAKKYGVDNQENNIAKEFARKIYNKNVVIYSGDFLSPVALRWKTQMAENSKHMVLTNVFPEMNHNEIMAWNFPSHYIKNSIVFFLYDRGDHERIKLRMDLTADILSMKSIQVQKIESDEQEPVQRMFSLLLLGDWISFYLALLNGVDPTEIKEISYLKTKLASSNQ
ncbi:MAG TPA: bifunctional phosphoglucose/phosphomannose isomerase [bacterium]|nr:bifunctional phosphoglucose/phosphomannose isomerase [bacterium]HOL35786.1 bifunctional phosphoglucose/phosphomannose isomerase [bacterium]HPP07834.1 bifunctional phosphoglucose/phosphomannose isomerase [bacterium]